MRLPKFISLLLCNWIFWWAWGRLNTYRRLITWNWDIFATNCKPEVLVTYLRIRNDDDAMILMFHCTFVEMTSRPMNYYRVTLFYAQTLSGTNLSLNAHSNKKIKFLTWPIVAFSVIVIIWEGGIGIAMDTWVLSARVRIEGSSRVVSISTEKYQRTFDSCKPRTCSLWTYSKWVVHVP